jgi:hypothetical protein
VSRELLELHHSRDFPRHGVPSAWFVENIHRSGASLPPARDAAPFTGDIDMQSLPDIVAIVAIVVIGVAAALAARADRPLGPDPEPADRDGATPGVPAPGRFGYAAAA